MSARPAVVALLRRYDDDSWSALANRGLLRRARRDLEQLQPQLSAEDDGGVEVQIDDRTVRIPLAGPGHATCTCPSTSVCQHVLAAGLWLADVDDEPDPDAAAALHDEVMALDRDALVAAGGRAAYRWAHQFVSDLEEPPVVERGSHLGVSFSLPDVRLRYFGGGVDSWVLDQALPAPGKYRVAAVLAWQRAHGLELEALPVTASRRGPTATQRSQADSRERLLAVVAELLADTVRVGVSHLSGAVLDRFTTAAVWAQGAELHRLALLLRRIADQVELLLLRRSSADDLRLLDELALAHALVSALRVEAAPHLVGRARHTYDPVRELRLLGLGSTPWRTGSGYHGLTTLFWDPERERFLTWTDARPTSLATFDPRARFRQPSPWPGLSTPQQAAGRQVRLADARLSSDARLSGVEATTATVTEPDHDTWRRLVDGATTSWTDLARTRSGVGESLLSAPRPASAWALLRPASSGAVVFDRARQVLEWPVVDEDGAVLALELPWAEHLAHAIDRVERLAALDGSVAVVARVRGRAGTLVGEPVSLLRATSPRVDLLHFDEAPATRSRPGLVERLRRAATPPAPVVDDPPDDGWPGPGRRVAPALVATRTLLEQRAQRGVAGLAPGVLAAEVERSVRALRDQGFHVFPERSATTSDAELLLRTHYLVQQVERVLG
ncbi:hypothetical protein [Nocardioides zeicaulis]|uniref:SWIM-type domain-containing protein n=1 Tax=Nocardioides zeicaulis TaxID=1776857 RepID=A0ABV6E4S4_9ACTN